eukprot:4418195-Karenia_brevis.AAC.1
MVRLALDTATTFRQCKALLDTARDDVLLASLARPDYMTFDTPAIVDTLDRAISHAFLPGPQ